MVNFSVGNETFHLKVIKLSDRSDNPGMWEIV